ncbi:MAG: DUF502 domain-containing protein [Methylococcales bacterium]|nr:DUF502 domain-containing protein [Methylococcales bacterium]
MKKLLNFFLIGILAFIPIYVIGQIVLFVNDRFSDLIKFVYGYYDNYFMTALIFIVSFSLFTYVGYRVSVGKSWIIASIDAVIDRIPLLNTVYRVTKKVVNMFSGHETKESREVVYIEYPKEGLWVPAYVTNRSKDMYILFVPTSPNPTSGFTVIVHESKVFKSEMNIEQATSFIISVGVDYDNPEEALKLPR